MHPAAWGWQKGRKEEFGSAAKMGKHVPGKVNNRAKAGLLGGSQHIRQLRKS